ncbi:MAG: S8 family serine peptidase, partial [Planctomycetota bacterium]
AHVEGQPNAYRPDLRGPDFDAVAVSLRSGPSEPSAHATQTARVIYGNAGLAPGVEVVHAMTTGDYLGRHALRADTLAPPLSADDEPTAFSPRVYTHSWIGNPPENQAARILRRLDHHVDTRDVLVVAGVNNGADSPVPALLGSAHNAIAVGAVNGRSSGGGTTVETPGRAKPDLVAANGLTSFATPVVAAVAALCLEQADRLVEQGHPTANRAEVIKAALLTGATKPPGWTPAPGRPLDNHLGAGEVHLDRALRILAAPAAAPGSTIKRLSGWAYPTLENASTASFDLKLPIATGPVTLTAVWHRRIDGRTARVTRRDTNEQTSFWLDTPRLADIDLRLLRIDDTGTERELAASTSRLDNVEHLHLPSLDKGHYRLELTRDPTHDSFAEPWEVALAWFIDRPASSNR